MSDKTEAAETSPLASHDGVRHALEQIHSVVSHPVMPDDEKVGAVAAVLSNAQVPRLPGADLRVVRDWCKEYAAKLPKGDGPGAMWAVVDHINVLLERRFIPPVSDGSTSDPVGTVRDMGNRTSFAEDNPLAHVNRYFIKWSPTFDQDESYPWVALNHELGLQRISDEVISSFPVVDLAEVGRRLAIPSMVSR